MTPEVDEEMRRRALYATARVLGIPLLSQDRLIPGYAEAGDTVTVVW